MQKELTKVEEQIMSVVWELEKGFIRDILNELPEPKPSYNSIGVFLKILEDKGFVSRVKFGNTFEYKAVISRKTYTKSVMKTVLAKYFNGSVERILSYFVENKELDLETLAEFQEKIKKSKK